MDKSISEEFDEIIAKLPREEFAKLLPRYPDWISVKDRLPNQSNVNIICLINNKPILCAVHDCTFSLTKNNVSFYWPDNTWIKDIYYSEVTHWMPLPDPPNELGN